MKRRHYQFGTILDLNEHGIKAFCRATAHDVMLKYTNVIGGTPKPLRDETNRLKNIPTWGAALRSWRREQENTKLAGGGGHPQKQLYRAELEYDYTRHFSLLKVMLLGAVPVVDAHDSNVFATPQVMRTLGPEAGGSSFVKSSATWRGCAGRQSTGATGRVSSEGCPQTRKDASCTCGRRGSS
jgi:hypothetical protein